MAKNKYSTHQSKSVLTITTPSFYGSHESMVIEDLGNRVRCKDDRGEYETEKVRLDNGLADPNRNNQNRFN
jgi:hypothetical protein